VPLDPSSVSLPPVVDPSLSAAVVVAVVAVVVAVVAVVVVVVVAVVVVFVVVVALVAIFIISVVTVLVDFVHIDISTGNPAPGDHGLEDVAVVRTTLDDVDVEDEADGLSSGVTSKSFVIWSFSLGSFTSTSSPSTIPSMSVTESSIFS